MSVSVLNAYLQKIASRVFIKETCGIFLFVFAFLYFVASVRWKETVKTKPFFLFSSRTVLQSAPVNSIMCPTFERKRHLPTIFVITPTANRWAQRADLTRMSQTLRLVPELHWVVVEDGNETSEGIGRLLNMSCLHYTHLAISTLSNTINNDNKSFTGRGMVQRNMALDHLRDLYKTRRTRGVVYFADDDNTYDVRLFNYIRRVTVVGVWAVGLIGVSNVEHAVVDDTNTVTGWKTTWGKRMFSVDMAGFAVNLQYILADPNVRFDRNCRPGYHEDCFLKALNITINDLQPFGLAEADKENGKYPVYVWHTKTRKFIVKKVLPDFDV